MAVGGRPWWPLVVSAFCGALIAGLVLLLTTGGEPAVRSASATHAVTTSPAPAPEPRIVFIGDSWTEGIGATAMEGYAVVTAERLGWDYQVLGVGGSGYVALGWGATFEQRIDRAAEFDPDVVDQLRPAALRTLRELQAEVDDGTQILVVGASYVPGEQNAMVAGINQTIGSAAAEAGLRFVDPSVENWTDPTDPSIWADPKHPNDRGVRQVADHLVPLLRELVAG
jgi:lysophospholipase L1-like esterase